MFPMAIGELLFWWPWQWIMATLFGAWTAFMSLAMRGPFKMGVPLVVRNPLSCHSIQCECAMRKAYLESVKMLTAWSLDRRRPLVRATSSACWDVVPGGRACVSMTSVAVTTA